MSQLAKRSIVSFRRYGGQDGCWTCLQNYAQPATLEEQTELEQELLEKEQVNRNIVSARHHKTPTPALGAQALEAPERSVTSSAW